jgi:hypothetical protein
MVVQPNSEALLGPILYLPQLKASNFYQTDVEDIKASIFVLNNYTGLDRLDLTAQTGVPKLAIQAISILTHLTFPLSPTSSDFLPQTRKRERRSFVIRANSEMVNGGLLRTADYKYLHGERKSKFNEKKTPYFETVIEVTSMLGLGVGTGLL